MSAHPTQPHPLPLKLQSEIIRYCPEDEVLFSEYFTETCFVKSTLAENGENLTSAQPRISAHLELAPTLKI